MTEKSDVFQFGVESMRAALETLSLAPEKQRAYLATGGYGDCADELALDFDDAYKVLEPHFGKTHFPKEAESLLKSIDSQLKAISGEGRERFWTTSALKSEPEWNSIRALAAQASRVLPK